jgi:hypothetical protein
VTVNYIDNERAVLASAFKTAMDPVLSADRQRYPNQTFTAPDDGTYVAFTFNSGPGDKIELNNPASSSLHRYSGLVIVQVFQKENTGTSEARQLANTVVNTFRDKEIPLGGGTGLLRFQRSPEVRTIGVQEGWYQLNVFCPYNRDVFQ